MFINYLYRVVLVSSHTIPRNCIFCSSKNDDDDDGYADVVGSAEDHATHPDAVQRSVLLWVA